MTLFHPHGYPPNMSVLGIAGTVRPLPTTRRFAAGEFRTWACNCATWAHHHRFLPSGTPCVGVTESWVLTSCADWALRHATCASASAAAWLSDATPRMPAGPACGQARAPLRPPLQQQSQRLASGSMAGHTTRLSLWTTTSGRP